VSKREVVEFVSQTRAELSSTLDEIEHRLSPKEISREASRWVSNSYDRNPATWLIAGGVVVVGAVAAVLWAVFSDD
jgi:type VI protein secretion system component VasF